MFYGSVAKKSQDKKKCYEYSSTILYGGNMIWSKACYSFNVKNLLYFSPEPKWVLLERIKIHWLHHHDRGCARTFATFGSCSQNSFYSYSSFPAQSPQWVVLKCQTLKKIFLSLDRRVNDFFVYEKSKRIRREKRKENWGLHKKLLLSNLSFSRKGCEDTRQ